jgi:hypothetical protein
MHASFARKILDDNPRGFYELSAGPMPLSIDTSRRGDTIRRRSDPGDQTMTPFCPLP